MRAQLLTQFPAVLLDVTDVIELEFKLAEAQLV